MGITKLVPLLLILFIPVAYASQIYVVDLEVHDHELSLINIYVKEGTALPYSQDSTYRYEAISPEGEVLLEGMIPITLHTHDTLPPLSSSTEQQRERYDISDEEVQQDTQSIIATDVVEQPVIEEEEFTLRIPYHPQVISLMLYFSDKKVLTIDTTPYYNSCGDDTCQDSESYESCAQDCPSGAFDGYCDAVKDNRCDPDCTKEDPDCKIEVTEEQISYEKKHVCQIDGVCSKGENAKNCFADCESSTHVYALLIVAALFILLLLSTSIERWKKP